MVISSLGEGASGGVLETSHGPVRRWCESRESDRVERQGEINEPIFFSPSELTYLFLKVCFFRPGKDKHKGMVIEGWSVSQLHQTADLHYRVLA